MQTLGIAKSPLASIWLTYLFQQSYPQLALMFSVHPEFLREDSIYFTIPSTRMTILWRRLDEVLTGWDQVTGRLPRSRRAISERISLSRSGPIGSATTAYRLPPRIFNRRLDDAAGLRSSRCNRLPQLYQYLASCYTHMGWLGEPGRSLSGSGPPPLSSYRASFLTDTQQR